jgi:hypothetical protein
LYSIFQPPVLNPRDDMKITDEAFYDLLERVQLLEKRLEDSPVHKLPNREGKSFTQQGMYVPSEPEH